jgi:hypothetical protein
MTELQLDWCSYEAAKYAVEHWHYSRALPASKLVKVGVWEDNQFIGCVLFGRGANKNIGKPYRLEQIQVCELVRIALKKHETPVSKIAAIAIKMLKKQSPELRLVVSYADPKEGHNGAIYQAMNWLYVGKTEGGTAQIKLPSGEIAHKRTVYSRYGTTEAAKVGSVWFQPPEKHKYLFPLDSAMRKQIEPLRKPYPKRDRGETDNAPQSNAETEGASPIRSLIPIRRLDAGG